MSYIDWVLKDKETHRLVAYYQLNETEGSLVTDSSGNGYHATLRILKHNYRRSSRRLAVQQKRKRLGLPINGKLYGYTRKASYVAAEAFGSVATRELTAGQVRRGGKRGTPD